MGANEIQTEICNEFSVARKEGIEILARVLVSLFGIFLVICGFICIATFRVYRLPTNLPWITNIITVYPLAGVAVFFWIVGLEILVLGLWWPTRLFVSKSLKCPDCRKMFPGDYKSCPFCGVTLEHPSALCPSCGNKILPTFNFCYFCGLNLEKSVEDLYEKVLQSWISIEGGGRRRLELKIKHYEESGLTREQAIRKIAKELKIL